ncbi:MAG: hypothetical protein HY011_09070 [Acidobacteria bacterium]|nr:hypothetical protein [Acidobacteriota bacterium]
MNRVLPIILAACACALTACQSTTAPTTQTVAAQQTAAPSAEKHQLYNLMIRRPQPGLGDDYDNFVRTEANPLRIKGGIQQMDVWNLTRGGMGGRIFMHPIEKFADLDHPAGISRVLDAKAAAAFWQKHGRMLANDEAYTLEHLPELSWTSPNYKAGMQKAAVLRFIKVAPGREREYENYFRNVEIPARLKLVAQTTMLGQWRYRVRFGGDSYSYVMLRPMMNFAELDDAKGLRELLGAEAAQKLYSQLPPGVVVADEACLLRYRPELSIAEGKLLAAK